VSDGGGRSLETFPIHLGKGATAVPQPEFPRDERAMQWYIDYARRTQTDGAEGRVISLFRFTENWGGWEMHPAGDEVVVCLTGEMHLTQEFPDGHVETMTLRPGEYAINPAGVWHTADIPVQASGLFVTAGAGTQNRPR
jgi:mannose-6-phosphate isomerase-like protein (cupin superfamily)